MKKYKVLCGELVDGESNVLGREGEVIEMDETSDFTQTCEQEGIIEVVSEDMEKEKEEANINVNDHTANASTSSDTSVGKTQTLEYMGKKVAVSASRTVNEKTYHHVTLEDGTTHDLTEEEYANLKVIVE